jgi:hypothetical protein
MLRLWGKTKSNLISFGLDIGISNIHAVDISYPEHDLHGKITDRRAADRGNQAGLDKYDALMVPIIRKYPKNYHSQLFQNLDIRDEHGEKILFNHIISSYSLGEVLELDDIPEEIRIAMIDRVIAHLAPSGLLMFFPSTLSPESPFGEKYYHHLEELRKSGVIHDYSIHDKNSDQLVLVIRK